MASTLSSNDVVTEHNMLLPGEFFAQAEKTFQYEDKLPSLPVPPLAGAVQMYLDSVRLHVTDEEYQKTKALAEKFQQDDGKLLYEKLCQRAKGQRNWMEKWWEDKAYLEARTPLAPFCNFTGPGPEFVLEQGKQTGNLAMTIWYMLQYYNLVRKETLKVDKAGKKKPFSMDQVRSLFCTYRRPGESRDSLHRHFKTEREGSCSREMVVLCRGYVYKMDVVYDDGSLLTVPEIQTQLDHILHQCNSRPYGPSVGALTSEERTKWYHLREHIIKLHPDNAKHLEVIERCILCAAFDKNTPVTNSQKSHAGLCGDVRNRWFDKSVVAIGFENGATSCNCDHSPYDGITAVEMLQYMIRGSTHSNYTWLGTKHIRTLKRPTEMVFHLDDTIHTAVSSAVQTFNHNSSRIEVYNPIFTDFGKRFLKQVRMHPDSFIQIALHLGYYRLHRRFVPTYETGTARLFWHGRTETARTCTEETANFCKAMCDSSVSDSDRSKLLTVAYDKHVDLMTKCSQFQACDRLFLGLYCIAEEERLPLPQLFTDPAFVKSGGGGNFTLSTSCVGFYPIHGGMAPMVQHGYGFFYAIQDDSFRPFITCYKDDPDTSTSLLYDYVSQAFRDLKQLLELKATQSNRRDTSSAKL